MTIRVAPPQILSPSSSSAHFLPSVSPLAGGLPWVYCLSKSLQDLASYTCVSPCVSLPSLPPPLLPLTPLSTRPSGMAPHRNQLRWRLGTLSQVITLGSGYLAPLPQVVLELFHHPWAEVFRPGQKRVPHTTENPDKRLYNAGTDTRPTLQHKHPRVVRARDLRPPKHILGSAPLL